MIQFASRQFHSGRITLQIRSISFSNRVLFSVDLSPERHTRRKQSPCVKQLNEATCTAIHKRTVATIDNSTHPRNAFQGSYDMKKISSDFPDLKQYLRPSHASKGDRETIDFSDPHAVKTLNAALLASDYGVTQWESFLPPSALTPPIPGRADYIHNVADVLYQSATGQKATMSTRIEDMPRGPNIVGLDIGVGGSLIYPLIGTQTFGWSFLGSDIDREAAESARQIVMANGLSHQIDVRVQQNQRSILHGILKSDEKVDFVMCNPPFYPSEKSFRNANQRKIRNLSINRQKRKRQQRSSGQQQQGVTKDNLKIHKSDSPLLPSAGSDNFLGRPMELWYPGGEVAFISSIIRESFHFADRCLWFSSLVSRRNHASLLVDSLQDDTGTSGYNSNSIKDIKVIPVGQGQKKTNIIFWSFHTRDEQQEWCRDRFTKKE